MSLIDEGARAIEDDLARKWGYVSAAELADCVGITERYWRRLVADGYLPKPDQHGKYPAFRSLRAYIRFCELVRMGGNR